MVALRFLLLVLAGAFGCQNSEPPADPNVAVQVRVVAIDAHDLPVVLLEETDGPRWLPIWIGTSEARSIARVIEEAPLARPDTHDLAEGLIRQLSGELERVVVTKLQGSTYYAHLVLRSNGRSVDIDARPSDAIAIALRADVPIFVRSSLLDTAPSRNDVRPDGRGI